MKFQGGGDAPKSAYGPKEHILECLIRQQRILGLKFVGRDFRSRQLARLAERVAAGRSVHANVLPKGYAKKLSFAARLCSCGQMKLKQEVRSRSTKDSTEGGAGLRNWPPRTREERPTKKSTKPCKSRQVLLPAIARIRRPGLTQAIRHPARSEIQIRDEDK